MYSYLLEQFKENTTIKLIGVLFIFFAAWWITIFLRGYIDSWENNYFTITYPILAFIGGSVGWFLSKKWGGFKSSFGSSLGLFSLGFFSQFLGQILYNYYIYILGIAEPYPSIGDAAFFASVLFYIGGAYQLAKVSGIKFTMQTIGGKFQAIIIPLIILVASYMLLLRDYEFDFSDPVLLFLDYGFPVGQAIFVSIAILALLMSRETLGGMMRKPIVFLLAALVLQYVSDFAYSIQYSINPDVMYVGDYLDLLYMTSYALMAIALISIGNMFYKVQKT